MTNTWWSEEPSDYDGAVRFLLRYAPRVLLPWLLGEPFLRFHFAGWLDTRRLSLPGAHRTNDLVARYALTPEHGLPRCALVEVEYRPRRALAGRLLAYLGFALNDLKPTDQAEDEYLPTAVVIALTGRARTQRDSRDAQGHGLLFVPREINLSDLDAAEMLAGVRSGQVPWPVLAWYPLFKGAESETLCQEYRELVAGWPDEEQRGVLKRQAIVYARVHGRVAYFHELLKGINVIRDPYVEEMRDEGRVENSKRFILQLLKNRFGTVADPIALRLEQIEELARLERLFTVALSVKSLEELVSHM
jgi:hypothetical protein